MGYVQGRHLRALGQELGCKISDLGSKARGRVWGARPLGAGLAYVPLTELPTSHDSDTGDGSRVGG